MTDKQILEKAIEKAIKNGFEWSMIWSAIDGKNITTDLKIYDEENIEFHSKKDNICSGSNRYWTMSIWRIIFSHSFAKAFWKKEKEPVISHTEFTTTHTGVWEVPPPTWREHLQAMVLEENPLKYLEKFLDDSKRK